MECIFCSGNEIKSRIIYKDNLVWAMPTNIPITPGHTLVLPVRCVGKIDDLTVDEWSAIKDLTIKIKNSLRKVMAAEGFNLAWNEGDAAGQSVKHIHLHIVPRKKGDAGIYEYDPRKFLYRPGSRDITAETELNEVAELIKGNL